MNDDVLLSKLNLMKFKAKLDSNDRKQNVGISPHIKKLTLTQTEVL
jgi:hypothetical protein